MNVKIESSWSRKYLSSVVLAGWVLHKRCEQWQGEEFKWVDIKDAAQCTSQFWLFKYLIQRFQPWMEFTFCCNGIYEQLMSQSSYIIGLFNWKTDNTGAEGAKLSEQASTGTVHTQLLRRVQKILKMLNFYHGFHVSKKEALTSSKQPVMSANLLWRD